MIRRETVLHQRLYIGMSVRLKELGFATKGYGEVYI